MDREDAVTVTLRPVEAGGDDLHVRPGEAAVAGTPRPLHLTRAVLLDEAVCPTGKKRALVVDDGRAVEELVLAHGRAVDHHVGDRVEQRDLFEFRKRHGLVPQHIRLGQFGNLVNGIDIDHHVLDLLRRKGPVEHTHVVERPHEALPHTAAVPRSSKGERRGRVGNGLAVARLSLRLAVHV